MKKLTFVTIMTIAAATFTGCGSSTPKADLKTDVDTLSYTIGLAQTQGLKEYLIGRMNISTIYMDQFIKGLSEGANAGDDRGRAAYYVGIRIGQQTGNQMITGVSQEVFGSDSTRTISPKNSMTDFIAGTADKKGLMTIEETRQVAQTKMSEIGAKVMEKEYGPNKAASERFLAENKKKDGVKTLPSGVQYKVIKVGNSAMPADTSMVKVHYEDKTLNGKVFDSSYRNGQSVSLRANRVIKGWTEALIHMPVGSVWEMYIPQKSVYGEHEQGQVKPSPTLIFKIGLVSTEK